MSRGCGKSKEGRIEKGRINEKLGDKGKGN
jgi:hypothetical protein